MKSTLLQALLLVTVIASATHSRAQSAATGDLVVNPYNGSNTGSITSSSFTLAAQNVAGDYNGDSPATGTFADINYLLSTNTPVSGLSLNTSVTEAIPDFLVMEDYDASTTSVAPGTDILDFELTGVKETGFDAGSSTGSFDLTGILTDSLGQIYATPVDMTVGYSGPISYSFTLDAVSTPEPSSWMLGLGALSAFVGLGWARRRMSA